MHGESCLPDYKGGSIVNLMGSISRAFGGTPLYEPLKGLGIEEISGRNVALLILDGLGFEYVRQYGKGGFLHENLRGEMTSVFPATTVAALTGFMTGVAPQQHGLTGWFMYLREIGAVSAVLPFTTRVGNLSLEKKVGYGDIYRQESFFEGLNADSFSLQHEDYFDSAYSRLALKGSKRLAFSGLSDFFTRIEETMGKGKERRFMLAYWARFDSISHHRGTDSPEALEHFLLLDEKIAGLAKSLKDNNTAIIVAADHGLVNTRDEDRIIRLEAHPRLAETMSMPLTGEPRVVYCYVKPHKAAQFEDYVRTNLAHACSMHRSEDLIEKNYFGLYEPNEKLKDRVGDYTLIMKDNYIMTDSVPGEGRNAFIGNHGGVSREEMIVPLIVV